MSKIAPKINKKFLTQLSLIFLAVIVGIFVLIALFARFFISYSYIENKFEQLIGLKIELINPQTNFDYKFNINTKAKEINIYDKSKKTKFLSLSNPQLSFKPIGLIFNKAYFKKINADSLILNVERDKSGKINLLEEIDKNCLKYFENKKTQLTKLNLDIKETKFIFKDAHKIESKVLFDLKDTKIKLSKRKKNVDFSQTGYIETYIANKKQTSSFSAKFSSAYPLSHLSNEKLNIDAKLNDVDLFMFSDFAKKYISKDISFLTGIADFEIKTTDNTQQLSIDISNPKIKTKYENQEKTVILSKKPIEIKGLFDVSKELIDFKNLKINSQDLSVDIAGLITKPFSKKPNVDLNINIPNAQINNLVHLLPDNAIFYRPQGIPTLKKSNFYANLTGSINLKLFPLNITGNIKAQDVHIPNYPKTYRQNDVNVIFMGDKVRIYTRVYTPENEHVIVDGISNLDDSLYGKYSIKSTSKIDLEFAQKYLVPIQQIIGFNIGPVPIMKIKGFGNINIDTQGTLKDAQIFGEFNAYNAQAQIDGLDAKLINGDCKLIFDDKTIEFKRISGDLDGAKFNLSGTTNIKGEVDLNAKITEAKSQNILKIFKNSIISKPYVSLVEELENLQGEIEIDANLKGIVKDFEDKAFFEKLIPSGKIILRDNIANFKNNIFVKKISGLIEFGKEQNGEFDFNLDNSKFNLQFNSKDSLEKIIKKQKFNLYTQLFSNKIASSDVMSVLKKSGICNDAIKNIISEFEDINFYTKLYLKSQGSIAIDDIDIKSFVHNGYIIGLNSSEIKNFKFESGIIKIVNSKVFFNDINAKIKEGIIKIKGEIDNISQIKPDVNLTISLKDISLEKLNNFIPQINTSKGIIKNGSIAFRGNEVKFNSFSMNYGATPVFLNAKIKDVYSLKGVEAEISTIIDEASCDNIINPFLISPVKIIGELPIKVAFKGNEKNYFVDFSAIIPKNSDISFGGANLGDVNHKREVQGKINVNDNVATFSNFKLINYIANQNNKINQLVALKASGQIAQENDKVFYNDFRITTNTPMNVRVLNLIFKKSLLKNGNFDCNIVLNGDIKLPKVVGRVNLRGLDIPLHNIYINNIKVAISDKFIDAEVLANNKESDLKVNLHALNKLIAPYVVKDVLVFSNKIDVLDALNSITLGDSKVDISKKQNISIKPEELIIEKGSFNIKKVEYDKISAQNLRGNMTYKNGLLDLTNLALDIAQGKIIAFGKYDIKTTKLKLDAKMHECDSNLLASSFLGLQNQIFGKMNGEFTLDAKNLNTLQGIKDAKSNIDFSINNGKMPKLGSLEYLLRAGNLFKNGIFGLSLNNIIEVLTPYKTGEFEKINGKMYISDGEIETLQILSQGKNLSMYLDGNYSILENFADIKIYGKLSQNISNALGAVGNASLSQFANLFGQNKKEKNDKYAQLNEKLKKIPSIEIENPEPRYFKVKVLGDINKENYIKNFDWL